MIRYTLGDGEAVVVFQLLQESDRLVFSLQDKVVGELREAYHGGWWELAVLEMSRSGSRLR